jgi:hypothetical protein
MAKIEVPSNIEIPALKVKQAQDVDLMAAGPGIPWEDRGNHGPVGGYLKTVTMALTSPRKLYEDIRRPNVFGDARTFGRISSAFWAVGVLVDAVVWYVRFGRNDPFDIASFIPHLVIAVAAPFIFYGLMNLALRMFNSMADNELKRGTPTSLAANVFMYATAGSVLAPFLVWAPWGIGSVVVFGVIATIAIVGARTRMRLSTSGAVVNVLMPIAGVGALALVGSFGVKWLWWLLSP